MIPPLTSNERRSVARVAVTTCVVSVLLLPLANPPRLSADTARETSQALRGLPDIPPPLAYPALEIRHDPFVRPAPTLAGEDFPPDLVLPPNAGIATPPHLQALILGDEPKALVEVDGRTAIVGVGTKLEGAAIVGIDSRGVVLDNGQRLGLEGRNP